MQHAGQDQTTDIEVFRFHLSPTLGQQQRQQRQVPPKQRKLAKGENDKGAIFSQNPPPTAHELSLPLFLSFSPSYSLLCCFFLHKIPPCSACPSYSVCCVRKQLAHELDQIVMENKKRGEGGNGTLGQLVRVRLGMVVGEWVGGGRRGNSSGSRIPPAHRAISGATRGGTKQELIRGAVKTKSADLAETLGWRGK